MTDYGFAPQLYKARSPAAPYIKDLQEMFKLRTRLVPADGFVDLRSLIFELGTQTLIHGPLGDLLLGAHANSSGDLFLPMYTGQTTTHGISDVKGKPTEETTLETLRYTLDSSAYPPHPHVRIPDPLIDYVAGEPKHSVHIRGCNLGKAAPMLRKFKQALGGHVWVTAPRHFHGTSVVRGLGVFEWMAYEFTVTRPEHFDGTPKQRRNAVIDAFQRAKLRWADDTLVPADAWTDWIPKSVDKSQVLPVWLPLGVDLDEPDKRIRVRQGFRRDHNSKEVRQALSHEFAVGQAIPAEKDMIEFMATTFSLHPMFQSNYPTSEDPFPLHRRLGYASFSDYFNGHKWSCSLKGRTLTLNGRRNVYTVQVPITDSEGNLVFNFYPERGLPYKIEPGLVETDTRYFVRV